MSEKRERFITVIPVSNDGDRIESVGINFPRTMTPLEWRRFMHTLSVVQEGIVAPTESEGTP